MLSKCPFNFKLGNFEKSTQVFKPCLNCYSLMGCFSASNFPILSTTSQCWWRNCIVFDNLLPRISYSAIQYNKILFGRFRWLITCTKFIKFLMANVTVIQLFTCSTASPSVDLYFNWIISLHYTSSDTPHSGDESN